MPSALDQPLKDLVALYDSTDVDFARASRDEVRSLITVLARPAIAIDVLIHRSVTGEQRGHVSSWLCQDANALGDTSGRRETRWKGGLFDITVNWGSNRPPLWRQAAVAPVLLAITAEPPAGDAWEMQVEEEMERRVLSIVIGPGRGVALPGDTAGLRYFFDWPPAGACPLHAPRDLAKVLTEVCVAHEAGRVLKTNLDAVRADRDAVLARVRALEAQIEVSQKVTADRDRAKRDAQRALSDWRTERVEKQALNAKHAFDKADSKTEISRTAREIEGELIALKMERLDSSNDLGRLPDDFVERANVRFGSVVEKRLEEIEYDLLKSYQRVSGTVQDMLATGSIKATLPDLALEPKGTRENGGVRLQPKVEELIPRLMAGFFAQSRAKLTSVGAIFGILVLASGGGLNRMQLVSDILGGGRGWMLVVGMVVWTFFDARRLRREREQDALRRARAALRTAFDAEMQRLGPDAATSVEGVADRAIDRAKWNIDNVAEQERLRETRHEASLRGSLMAATSSLNNQTLQTGLARISRVIADQEANLRSTLKPQELA